MGSGLTSVMKMQSLQTTSLRSRAVLMVLASMLSDAACMPLNGIYGVDQISELISIESSDSDTNIEQQVIDFYPSCQSPQYNYTVGCLSPFGDELIPFLRHLTSSEGLSNVAELQSNCYEFYRTYRGQLNIAPKQFVQNKQNANIQPITSQMSEWGSEYLSNDHQSSALIRVPAVVSRYFSGSSSSTKELLNQVNIAAQTIQNSSLVASCARAYAYLLSKVLLTAQLPSIVLSQIRSAIVSKQAADTATEVQESQYLDVIQLDVVAINLLLFTSDLSLLSFWCQLVVELDKQSGDEFSSDYVRSALARVLETSLNSSVEKQVFLNRKMLREFIEPIFEQEQLPDSMQFASLVGAALDVITANKSADTMTEGELDVFTMVRTLGSGGLLPGAFLGTIALCLSHEKTYTDNVSSGKLFGSANSLRTLLRLNIKCGGESCVRGILLGALVGSLPAGEGPKLPAHWISSMNPECLAELCDLCIQVAARNSNSKELLEKIIET